MADPVSPGGLSSDSSDTDSLDIKCESDDDDNVTPSTSQVPESKDLLNMYTNVEIGVVSSMDKYDQCLLTVAQIKRAVAKAEKKLANCRKKEMAALQNLQSIQETLADKRISQADINVERAKYYHQHLYGKPRLVGSPPDLISSLSRPSIPLPYDIGYM